MININTIKNETKSKQMQIEFTDSFRLLSKELAPIIAKFLKENKVPITVAVFFFASLIKDSMETIDDQSLQHGLKEVIMKFIDE